MARILVGSYYKTEDGRPLRRPSEEHRQYKLMCGKARYSAHLRPEANKRRSAAFSEMQSAHRVLNQYKNDKILIATIQVNGTRHIGDTLFMNRIKVTGGADQHLSNLLATAKNYLNSASSFGQQKVLP